MTDTYTCESCGGQFRNVCPGCGRPFLWISVEDRLPEDETLCLIRLFSKTELFWIAEFYDADDEDPEPAWICQADGHKIKLPVTHWQEIKGP